MVLLLCMVAVRAAETLGLCLETFGSWCWMMPVDVGRALRVQWPWSTGCCSWLESPHHPCPRPCWSRAANRHTVCSDTGGGKWPEFSSDIRVKSFNLSQPVAQPKSELCLCEAFSRTMHSINENFLSSSLLLSVS